MNDLSDLFARPNRNAPGYDTIPGIRLPPRIIALTSPAMGSGKSVVADHLLMQHGFVALKFAGALKGMIRTMLSGMGFEPAIVEKMVEGDFKETVIDGLGVTPRHLMQTLGTEWGRNCVREDLWVYLTRRAVEHYTLQGLSVVIDDMRFPNELEMVRSMGGHAIRIVRPGATVTRAHASEGQLDNIPMLVIHNDGTLDDLRRHADTLATCPLR